MTHLERVQERALGVAFGVFSATAERPLPTKANRLLIAMGCCLAVADDPRDDVTNEDRVRVAMEVLQTGRKFRVRNFEFEFAKSGDLTAGDPYVIRVAEVVK